MKNKTKFPSLESKDKILDFQSDENSDYNINREEKIKSNEHIVKIESIKKEKIKKQKIEKKEIKKKKIQETDFLKLGIIAIAIIASISMLFTYIEQGMQIAELRERQQEILNQQKVEEKEIERLEKILSQVGSMEFIERQARERLGMIKPGETIYIDLNRGIN